MEKKYFTIKEVTKMLGIPSSKLRYWESVIPKLKPKSTAGGMRRYTEKDIELIQLIERLINEQHLTLEGVNVRLNKNVDAEIRILKVVQKLKSVRDELVGIRRELNAHEALADELIIDDKKE